jgi:hypothetical protein
VDGQRPPGADPGDGDAATENGEGSPKGKGESRREFWLRLRRSVIALSAAGVVVVGFLWVRERPLVPGFTRVGGATSVETAVDASTFWLSPPQFVVETPAGGKQMLGAAECAVALDAPLLFSSPDSKRQSLVNATISRWREHDRAAASTVTITSQADVTACPARLPGRVTGLSTLTASDRIIRLPSLIPRENTLAPTVIFAAPVAPGDSPDVAVGLALAAHLAHEGRPVSLVVVPRYLEADLQLEHQLRAQREQIDRSIVLGQTPTVSDDTRALLRQLVSTPSRLDQLLSLEPSLGLAVAILGLLGVFAAAAPAVIDAGIVAAEVAEFMYDTGSQVARRARSILPWVSQRVGTGRSRFGQVVSAVWRSVKSGDRDVETSTAQADVGWVQGLQAKEVIVWLTTGSTVAGVLKGLHAAGPTTASSELTVLRIEPARLVDARGQEQRVPFALVPVGRVDLIVPGPDQEQAEPPAS